MFGWANKKLRKLDYRTAKNERSIQILKECCKAFSDELDGLKNYITDQQEQINELRRIIEKAR